MGAEGIPDDVIYKFLGADFMVRNKETGKPIFEMKRKTPSPTEIYYIFRFIEEDADPEDLKKMREGFKEFMCPLAAIMGIGLFDYDELSKKMHQHIKELGPENIPDKKQIDVKIDIKNYATGTIDKLTVGISGPGYWGKTIDELEKEASGTGADNKHDETA